MTHVPNKLRTSIELLNKPYKHFEDADPLFNRGKFRDYMDDCIRTSTSILFIGSSTIGKTTAVGKFFEVTGATGVVKVELRHITDKNLYQSVANDFGFSSILNFL